MKQSSIEWFNQQLVDRQNGNGDSRSIDAIFEQAKAMHKEEQKQLTFNWANLREQTRKTAMHIGFTVGFATGIMCYEDYYEELEKSEMDEDDFRSKYISEIEKTFNRNYNEKFGGDK